MNFEAYAWLAQLALSLVLAALVARMADRKGRSPAAAAILMLTFIHGWPALAWAVGTGVGAAFRLNETARAVLARAFWAAGIFGGAVWSYVIVACWKGDDPPRPRDPE